MIVLPNIEGIVRQTFFAHYYRFIEDFFLPLRLDTSLAKRWLYLLGNTRIHHTYIYIYFTQ